MTKRDAKLQSVFEARSQLYAALQADPRIHRRTSFYAAAAVISRAFSHGMVTPFMATLSESLERFNLEQAERIRAGRLYSSGSIAANTAEFVRAEQTIVQQMLDGLRRRCWATYLSETAAANRAIAHVSRWYAFVRCRAYRELNAAIREAQSAAGRLPTFVRQSDRELIGNTLASRLGRAGNDGRA